jgi:hypothetical protein
LNKSQVKLIIVKKIKEINKIYIYIFFVFLTNVTFSIACNEQSLDKCFIKNVFWIATDSNNIFNKETVSFISRNAGAIILNARLRGISKEYDYPSIIEKFREFDPAIPIFLYTWGSVFHDTKRIGTYTLGGYKKLGPLLLSEEKDLTKKELRGDVRKREYRNWIVNKIVRMLNLVGADGVVLDEFSRRPKNLLRKK